MWSIINQPTKRQPTIISQPSTIIKTIIISQSQSHIISIKSQLSPANFSNRIFSSSSSFFRFKISSEIVAPVMVKNWEKWYYHLIISPSHLPSFTTIISPKPFPMETPPINNKGDEKDWDLGLDDDVDFLSSWSISSPIFISSFPAISSSSSSSSVLVGWREWREASSSGGKDWFFFEILFYCVR